MIVAYCGTLGAGKTLLMSICAYDEYLRGRKIYANYSLCFADRVTSWEELYQLENGVICIDELQVLADSRKFSSAQNLEMSQWLLQTRKIGLDFHFTTQGIDQVDKRFRTVLDYMFFLERLGGPGSGMSQWWFIDFQMGREKSSGRFRHHPALYGLYDTYQRISVLS